MSLLRFRNLLLLLAVLAAVPAKAFATPVVDGFWDQDNADGYTLSKVNYTDLGCGDPMSGGCSDQGVLGIYQDANNIYIMFAQQTSVNDNSYGTTSVDWSMTDPMTGISTPFDHQLSDLTGSDMAEFVLSSNGSTVWDGNIDYVSQSGSSYVSLGLGGDGGIVTGSSGALVAYATSIQYDLSSNSSCKADTTNSPDIDGNAANNGATSTNTANSTYLNNLTNPACSLTLPSGYTTATGWLFDTVYEIEISKSALGLTGVTLGATVTDVHNSPSKGEDTDVCDAGTGDILAPTLCGVTGQSPVPEPDSLVLLGTGVLGLATALRRRFRRA